jgi:hypothetical protein
MGTKAAFLRILIVTSIALTCFAAGASPAVAQVTEPATYNFVTCTNNNPGDVAIGQAQITMIVSFLEVSPADRRARFRFENSGANASSLARVRFYDPANQLLEPLHITNGPGVSFSAGTNPGGPVLPGGQDCPGLDGTGTMVFETHDSASAGPPPPVNGVNPGEWLEIEMRLSSWISFNDIVAGLGSGQIRIGIHVIAFASGGSESFVNLGDPQTYIQLASFDVEATDDGVVVQWETAVEIDNVGFNVYRATSPAGPYVKVNDLLIAAKGNGTGASYTLVDPDGEAAHVYRLEDIDYSGVRTMHLPIVAEAVHDNFVFLPMIRGAFVAE